MSMARERRNWPAREDPSPRLALRAAQVTAKIDFSMMVLLDIIKKGMQGNEFHCRQVLPTSGHRSCSVWDVPDIKVSTVRRNCAPSMSVAGCAGSVSCRLCNWTQVNNRDVGAELPGMAG